MPWFACNLQKENRGIRQSALCYSKGPLAFKFVLTRSYAHLHSVSICLAPCMKICRQFVSKPQFHVGLGLGDSGLACIEPVQCKNAFTIVVNVIARRRRQFWFSSTLFAVKVSPLPGWLGQPGLPSQPSPILSCRFSCALKWFTLKTVLKSNYEQTCHHGPALAPVSCVQITTPYKFISSGSGVSQCSPYMSGGDHVSPWLLNASPMCAVRTSVNHQTSAWWSFQSKKNDFKACFALGTGELGRLDAKGLTSGPI